MVLGLALDGHEPHTAVRFSRNTIGTGSFLRVFQRIETIDMPIYGPCYSSGQWPARQDGAAFLAASFGRICRTLDRGSVLSTLSRRDLEQCEHQQQWTRVFSFLFPLQVILIYWSTLLKITFPSLTIIRMSFSASIGERGLSPIIP
jgi:hypothetical protein